ncbi:hypothetical protein ABZ851_12895 [Streptomyces sp. NPDC047049]|uniref:hypothetical protein n=1 Tax=Streptomyces sp. NPDC047049 TaxID=3156688 RepID=UPI0033E12FA0
MRQRQREHPKRPAQQSLDLRVQVGGGSIPHIRLTRAHSLAGEPAAAYRAIDDALAAHGNSAPAGADLPSPYWANAGENHQAAASAALSLHDPARALEHVTAAVTHADPYDVGYAHHDPAGVGSPPPVGELLREQIRASEKDEIPQHA